MILNTGLIHPFFHLLSGIRRQNRAAANPKRVKRRINSIISSFKESVALLRAKLARNSFSSIGLHDLTGGRGAICMIVRVLALKLDG